jgi:hypothetical protein
MCHLGYACHVTHDRQHPCFPGYVQLGGITPLQHDMYHLVCGVIAAAYMGSTFSGLDKGLAYPS